MDRNSILRVVVIAAAILLLWKFGLPLITGSNDKPQSAALTSETFVNGPGFVPDQNIDPPLEPGKPNEPVENEICNVKGDRYEAVFSPRGAGLTHLFLKDAKYAEGALGMDLSTTPNVERWRNLRTTFRGKDANDQVKYDRMMWKMERRDKACAFTYEDEDVRIAKTFSAGPRPFEIVVDTQVTNLASAPKKHQFTISLAAYHKNKDLKGSLGRVSPLQTTLECASGKDVVRKQKDDFKSGWFFGPQSDRYGAVNSHYFSQAMMVPAGAEQPRCDLLSEEWFGEGQAHDADDAGNVFHSNLAYAPKELAPQASATYQQIAYFGPKERDTLAAAGGGSARLGDVINLATPLLPDALFRPVAKFLVSVLIFIHDKITHNWGIAIILLTFGLRTLLFPLTLKSIKATIAMRKLKPEVDKLNEKFKDDPQAKNLAMMELWKKHGVNPIGGCLPQLVQMPVWLAMYATLQTAVEMYHVKFLWFNDLSAPDQLFGGVFGPLPLLLGAFMIVQQRIVPQQGMDPVQAKMMMWMLPAIFTVMMLFLPAALGVYMLTNSVLGIVQQLAVEQIAPRGKDKGKEIVVKEKKDSGKDDVGRRKARV
jgi:YidC/Oxa1 family membrane protein insertase